MKKLLLCSLLSISATGSFANDSLTLKTMSDEIMLRGACYNNLRVLCKQIGHRLSGTPAAAKAVEWGQNALTVAGADKVWLQPVDVPYWIRGKESLKFQFGKDKKIVEVPVLSIGNTVGTDGKILSAPLIMVNSIDEFNALPAEKVKGSIVFFNYRFRQDIINTFDGYGDCGKYRWTAPNMAAAKGAVGTIIRSVSTGLDDAPHTGSMRYADTVKPIPAMAIGNTSADMLEKKMKEGNATAFMQSECRMEGTVRSYNVIGEITGSEYPESIVLVGGHLDSWDVGEGAHDDGAGCVQSIEVIRALKALGIRPKRTVRAVLFMNEENGLKGGLAYGDSAKARNERHILAIETDAGGFSPRGISLDMGESEREQIKAYRNLFLPYGVYDFTQEHGGADISPLRKQGVPAAGLVPDPQRYFDLHHTPNDVFEAVNHRELKLGAVTLTALVYLVSEHGLKSGNVQP
ncbi:M28 family peptidase [Polluticoccus soli]|uniref:M28 family peptidase n=1 Tax=Polluticoccus soli TaxID=3034150 RepID=UPI0023E0D516|nr:M28 family peptidase [Flavipsychrobacter sp. JY13-12]